MGGVQKAAQLLGEKQGTVYSWRRLDRAPSLRSACKIVRISGGKCDHNGIFTPFCERHFPECGD